MFTRGSKNNLDLSLESLLKKKKNVCSLPLKPSFISHHLSKTYMHLTLNCNSQKESYVNNPFKTPESSAGRSSGHKFCGLQNLI